MIMDMPLTRPKNAPPYFHIMAKPTGAICNLDCKYCFFLSKEALYPGSPFRMSDEVMRAYVKQVIESQRTPEITIAWQGGEPTLMGLDFFRRVMAVAQEVARPGIKINHTMQTNGTKLDDAWCQFLHEHDFLVGLSLDGTKEMHDAYRVDKRGDGTHVQVLSAARLLQKHQVEFNILCTVHAANADYPLQVYRYFRDVIRTSFIQFIPIIERATPELLPIANIGWGDYGNMFIDPGSDPSAVTAGGTPPAVDRPVAKSSKRPLYTTHGHLVTDRSVTAEQWGSFLITIFDEWVRRDVGKVFVQLFDSALGSWLGQGASICIHLETCGNALALEHNGDLYSCDHFVEPDYFLGNIKEEHMLTLVASAKQRKFGSDKRDTLPRYCLECPVRFACHGGCPRNRFIETPDGETGLNYLCAGYKAFFTHVDRPMRIMATLLRQGRYADEVMDILAQDQQDGDHFVNVGRNDPCPCGSGKKYKQCHGRHSRSKPI
ncbi:MAG: anaerobic sulfatase maturase [Candidatus Promineifilaceae bacterium]|nr:anaerobic sulfatase maturase [Candidatus Promineifilaceae bacterium]